MKSYFITGLEVDVYGVEHIADDAAVVFYVHGLGGNRRNGARYCESLAQAGYVAIAVDQRNHGQREVDSAYNSSALDTYLVNSYGLMIGTAHDISLIIDFLPTVLKLKTTRIGVTGFSLGAHVTFIAMLLDSRIKVAVPICGASNRKLQLSLRAKGPLTITPDLEFLFAKYDGIHNLNKFSDRALCMINGGSDQICMAGANQDLYTHLQAVYTDSSQLKLSIYPGLGHVVSDEMWNETLAWFNAKL